MRLHLKPGLAFLLLGLVVIQTESTITLDCDLCGTGEDLKPQTPFYISEEWVRYLFSSRLSVTWCQFPQGWRGACDRDNMPRQHLDNDHHQPGGWGGENVELYIGKTSCTKWDYFLEIFHTAKFAPLRFGKICFLCVFRNCEIFVVFFVARIFPNIPPTPCQLPQPTC